ncbi:MAG: hypothetical protein OXH09_14490 [Gammaproteobacteria bacterium]|nr:hypothetical protein [Gammaproteobacteria bacterium]
MKTTTTAIVMAAAALATQTAWTAEGVDAEFVVTSERAVGPDNMIRREMAGRYVADADGRMRVEMAGQTTINDPVAGLVWIVDDRTGRANRATLADSSEPRERIGAVVHPDLDPDEIPPAPERMPRPDPLPVEQSPLGTETVLGQIATGTLYLQTVPVGAVGNVEPYTIEVEVWKTDAFGFDLHLRTVVRDPVHGTTTQEMRNPQRVSGADLDALFEPDEEWTVVEGPPSPPMSGPSAIIFSR